MTPAQKVLCGNELTSSEVKGKKIIKLNAGNHLVRIDN